MKYRETKNVDYAKIGVDILEYWQTNKIFEKSVNQREGKPAFNFYEGPPSANGTPGIHHVMARTVKDIFCRYKTLKGYQVKRKGGWDTHGLPVELQVEKELGITKEDIGKKISIKEYNQKCREAVMKYKSQWDELTEIMGYWVDLDHPYVTFDKDYIESVWYLLKQLHEKDLLYKGYTIQPYSPAAGTGLSSHELNLPGCYRMVKDTSVVAQFKVVRDEKSGFLFSASENIYMLAWTTTPWTLPGNSALAVGENIRYKKVRTFNPYTHEPVDLILASELVPRYFPENLAELKLEDYKPGDKNIPYQLLNEYTGKQLTGISYDQLLPYVAPLYDADKAFRVIPGDFVSTEDGTGIVHISPTFGADDFRVAKAAGVPPITVKDSEGTEVPIVDKQGRYVRQMGELAGRFVKEDYYTEEERAEPTFRSTDVLISIRLKEENKAFRVEKYEHSYPHCWRTDKPVLYYPLDSWFVRTTAFKQRMADLNNTINWKPESTGSGRFGNWLENLVDWNLSRSRYWGTPLPVWVSEDKKEVRCIGSIEELGEEVERSIEAGFMSKPLPADFDPHRPYVDEIILVSGSGEAMYREPDLIDVWFDSGAMPYAQWHYPFGDKEVLGKNFPADFIAEGVDQTRGWFFTLHAISVMLFDSVAFKNVIANGLVLDKNGNKMSKSKGNVVNPFEAISLYGPDPVRWYMIENAPPWENLKFSFEGITEVQRRFFGTLVNTYSFFALYANLDHFEFNEGKAIPIGKRPETDRWILSRLQTLIEEVETAYEQYEPTRAARAIQDFVNDQLSNWYVRLNRKRYWKGEMSEDKQAAYETLFETLLTISQLMAPIAPFFADWLYANLTEGIRKTGKTSNKRVQAESVHLTDWPVADNSLSDKALEQSMDYAQRISSLVHSIRKNAKIKVRTPLGRILLPVLNEQFAGLVKSVEDIILSEVNVKKIEYITDDSGILVKKVKPNFKKLGKQYGPKLQEVASIIQSFDKQQIATLEAGDILRQSGYEFVLEDVEISSEDIPGWATASEGGLTVALDITLTDELRKEGIARDLVNRIQNLRKAQNMNVTDKIHVQIQKREGLTSAAIREFGDYISAEVQAIDLKEVDKLSDYTEVDMDEFLLRLHIGLQGPGTGGLS